MTTALPKGCSSTVENDGGRTQVMLAGRGYTARDADRFVT